MAVNFHAMDIDSFPLPLAQGWKRVLVYVTENGLRHYSPFDPTGTVTSFRNIIECWLISNCVGGFIISESSILFSDARDALLFHMKFSGENETIQCSLPVRLAPVTPPPAPPAPPMQYYPSTHIMFSSTSDIYGPVHEIKQPTSEYVGVCSSWSKVRPSNKSEYTWIKIAK